MASGYLDFVAGATLTAANLEDYCELQGIMRFASAAARDTALASVLTEGLFAYLIDVNTVTVYSGAAWSTIGSVHGAWTAWSPTLTQSGAVTKTIVGSYMRVGRMITANCTLTATGAGTASNQITVSLPVTASTSNSIVGTGYIIDASLNAGSGGMYKCIAVLSSSTAVGMYDNAVGVATASATGRLGDGANTMTAALASGDTVAFSITYEASADA